MVGYCRLAQCIIAPLWKTDAVDRELEAIESEFERAKTSDDARTFVSPLSPFVAASALFGLVFA